MVHMKNHSLVSHPLNQFLLELLSQKSYPESTKHYLLVSPPYSNFDPDPLRYFFESTQRHKLTRCDDPTTQLEKHSKVVSFDGREFQVLTSCLETTESGFTYAIIELDNNIYKPAVIPTIVSQIDRIADNTDLAGQFFFAVAIDKTVDIVTRISTELADAALTEKTFVEYVERIGVFCDELAGALEECPDIQQVGVYTRNRLNLAVFNFISAMFHCKLFPYFVSLYLEQDQHAHQAIIRWNKRHRRNPRLEFASFTRIFAEGLSTVEIIERVRVFFDEVVERVNDEQMGADKLLDILTEVMARNGRNVGHHISMFAFLEMIWLPNGLDDRIEYILATCANAAKELLHLK